MTAVRDELEHSPGVEHVVFALRGAAAYEAFARALSLDEPAPVRPLIASDLWRSAGAGIPVGPGTRRRRPRGHRACPREPAAAGSDEGPA